MLQLKPANETEFLESKTRKTFCFLSHYLINIYITVNMSQDQFQVMNRILRYKFRRNIWTFTYLCYLEGEKKIVTVDKN